MCSRAAQPARPLAPQLQPLELLLIVGLAGVFMANAIVALLEPSDFTGLLERSLVGTCDSDDERTMGCGGDRRPRLDDRRVAARDVVDPPCTTIRPRVGGSLAVGSRPRQAHGIEGPWRLTRRSRVTAQRRVGRRLDARRTSQTNAATCGSPAWSEKPRVLRADIGNAALAHVQWPHLALTVVLVHGFGARRDHRVDHEDLPVADGDPWPRSAPFAASGRPPRSWASRSFGVPTLLSLIYEERFALTAAQRGLVAASVEPLQIRRRGRGHAARRPPVGP